MIPSKTRGFALAPLIGFVLWVSAAWGQARSIRGTVVDETGHVLAGAVVQIEDRATLHTRSYMTGPDGVYYFEDLSSNLTYHLRATYSGISSHSKLLSKFNSQKSMVIDFTIHVRK